ncbi:MAG: VWA domain-containing protein [Pseudomonadota bacterium]|nr:VWA domain-containing protein [Pseudomonadota bacterium]
MKESRNLPKSGSKALENFLEKVKKTPIRNERKAAGRLVFGMDATASRERTWDNACQIQNQMFSATDDIGGINVQLCYYRGFNQFQYTGWFSSGKELIKEMAKVSCLGGHTQIAKIFKHALEEHKAQKIKALVFVGDALEENADTLCHLAGKFGVFNIPIFMFQEGSDHFVMSAFRQIALLSGGAYAPFNSGSVKELQELLSSVAVFVAGGHEALETYEKRDGKGKSLTLQLRK